MFYSYQILDYAMVALVVVLILYQLMLVRPSVKRLQIVDGIVALMTLLFTFSFFRNMNAYQNYFKILSACLVYYLGRLYSERIKECYSSLVAASYIVVYLNFFHRIYRQGFSFLTGRSDAGEFFYYKTDLAFAMLLSAIFIYYLGRRSLLKYFTLVLVVPYMVLYSQARTQQVLIFLMYFLFVLAHKEKNADIDQKLNWKLIVSLTGVLFLGFCFLIVAPYMKFFQSFGMKWGLDISNGILTEQNMQVRFYAWKDTLWGLMRENMWMKLFGVDLISDPLYNRFGLDVQNMYIKSLLSVGWIGCIVIVIVIISYVVNLRKLDKDRKAFYLALTVGILFLGTGMTVNAHEFTQMSWFPMMFFGMVVSGLQPEDEEIMQELAELNGKE